jgi:parvulin-like peptidyl-prolyl isomerase
MSIYKMRTQFGGALKVLLGIIAFGFLVGAIFSFGVAPSWQGSETSGGSDVVAIVNGSEIKREEYESAWQKAMYEANDRGIRSPLQYAEIRSMIFQQLVQSRLILAAAAEMGVDISNKKVNQEIDKAVVEYLKQNRDVILGKPRRGEDRPADPRDDRNYKNELKSIGSSIDEQEKIARSRVSEDQVRAQLAYEGIQSKIKASIKPVTDADVKASYNVYKIRQIVLSAGALPKEQISAKAKKIREAAVKGGDFAKLARENSDHPTKDQGGKTELTFENRWFLPPQVREVIYRMNPGDVSPVIDTQLGYYIVKLEAIEPRLPAKLDKKAMEERRKQIRQDREMNAQIAFQESLNKKQSVKVIDPELEAYWRLYEARQLFSDKAAYDKKMRMAISALRRAIKERPNNDVAAVKLAQLLNDQGKTEEAIRILYPMLEGKNARIEGADLRMLLGDMLVKTGEKDKAIENYKIASEIARADLMVHQQLVAKYQELKRPDLVAAEQKWIEEFNKRAEAIRNLQEKATPKPAPKAPKTGR